MAYHVEFKTKKDLEENIKPSVERKIAKLEVKLADLDRIKPDRLTAFEADKIASKTYKLNRLKAINTEINRVIAAKENKKVVEE